MIRPLPLHFLALAGVCWLIIRPRTSGEDLPAFRIGFSAASFAEVNQNDASAAVKVWARILASERRIAADPQPKILRNIDTILGALTNRLVDAINLTTQEYFIIHDRVALENFVVPVKGGSITEEYLLLVHQDAGFNQVTDLHKHTLGLLKSPRMSLAHAWLDTLLTTQGQPQIEDFFETYTDVAGITKVVLSVYFRRLDACVVTRSGFDTMLELNPQTGRSLKILASSPPIVPSVFGFRAEFDSPIRTQILADIARWHHSPPGRQILNLFQCDRLEERPGSVLDSTVTLMENHLRLCGPHTPGGASTLKHAADPLKPVIP